MGKNSDKPTIIANGKSYSTPDATVSTLAVKATPAIFREQFISKMPLRIEPKESKNS